jgi:hypothetical protein
MLLKLDEEPLRMSFIFSSFSIEFGTIIKSIVIEIVYQYLWLFIACLMACVIQMARRKFTKPNIFSIKPMATVI